MDPPRQELSVTRKYTKIEINIRLSSGVHSLNSRGLNVIICRKNLYR